MLSLAQARLMSEQEEVSGLKDIKYSIWRSLTNPSPSSTASTIPAEKEEQLN